jgi:hypothetical protein
MKLSYSLLSGALFLAFFPSFSLSQQIVPATPERSQTYRMIPQPLHAWKDWATWNDPHRDCPTPYHDAKEHRCFWPTLLDLTTERAGGKFSLGVTVYHETWVPLPGGAEAWPVLVTANGAPVAVVEHEGAPSVRLEAGAFRIEGAWRWTDLPQRLSIPNSVGILNLTLDGQPVAAPAWDAHGFLWLKRDGSSEETDKDFLSVKMYAALDDGIPLWWHTEIELVVSGKGREEDLGTILPSGWKLARVESPIPVAIDDAGRMKAQVRAGRWTVRAHAFRLDNPQEFRYPDGAKPPVGEQLVALRAKPEFRLVEVVGSPSIDVSQTTFPDQWRELPVYRWDMTTPFRIEERMRGMGEQKPSGLVITREWWLDEDGRLLTFRDRLEGQMQQTWRLDAAEGQELGSVRIGGQGQLITRNPQNAAPGVEIRSRSIDLEATGRMSRSAALSATGWRSDAEGATVSLNLPPGWRLFALFGADYVTGDWLTAWSLLDLFLLLIFTLAVFRLWGIGPAVLAFLAFGLSYHEPGAPRYAWLILLIPLALLRVVPEGLGRRIVNIGRWVALTIFVLVLVPFVARQVQQALYPQLEWVHGSQRAWSGLASPGAVFPAAVPEAHDEPRVQQQQVAKATIPAPEELKSSRATYADGRSYDGTSQKASDNLLQDERARIQTGPGVPEWTWRQVTFGWDGPVRANQNVRPVLISATLERVLSILRVALLIALAAILLGAKRWKSAILRTSTPAAAVLLTAFLFAGSRASAELPDSTTLEQLRTRLLEPSDAYPHAADIPLVALQIAEHRLTMNAEIHTAIHTAVPLPGRLPAWSPVSVFVNDKPEVALRRDDGYLWVVLPAGVHHVRVEGTLADATEWEWTFQLRPRQVTIDAPAWSFTGVRPDGSPESQVFFTLKQKATAAQATYDRQDLHSIAVIDRHLELGLMWQVRTTVTRLSPVGKAIALRVPLLPGENVLSSNALVRDGMIEVRLGAQEPSFSWESGVAIGNQITLAARPEDPWVERWHLVVSPVWNVALSGLPPIFEPANPALVPVWQPWPGEQVTLAISRPDAIAGATVTVSRGKHELHLGKRQRISNLELALRCSLGEDFLIDLPADAEITSLKQNGKSIPVRKDGNKVVVPLRPGDLAVALAWKTNTPLGFVARADEVRLPVESANISTEMHVPEDRWILWADGPMRGPAVRFWVILICSLIAALVLGRISASPLKSGAWMLLIIGLTQVPLAAAAFVVAWLFLLALRGRESFQQLKPWRYNLVQVALIVLTLFSLGILLSAVGAGLLGKPEMFISGNGSSHDTLRWFQGRSDGQLPRPGCISISIWWYRLLMLAWALWLATSLIRWLASGWKNFASGGIFHKSQKSKRTTNIPPPLPTGPIPRD